MIMYVFSITALVVWVALAELAINMPNLLVTFMTMWDASVDYAYYFLLDKGLL